MHVERWAEMGEVWSAFGTPPEIAALVINDLHEKLFAIG